MARATAISRGANKCPPARPGPLEEALAAGLFFTLGPRLRKVGSPSPPHDLEPFEAVRLPRSRGTGILSATWYPACAEARGAVLFLHPWVEWGQAYFHRRGRLEAVRAAGYHALTVDLPGFGGSGPRRGWLDLDVDDALSALAARAAGLPLFFWGVSSGGYWAHPALSRQRRVAAAMFEDVSPHLLEWSWRSAPWGRPAYLFFRLAFREAHRFLDLRRHAPHLGIPTAYVSGGQDRGVLPADTRRLAELASGTCMVVPDAKHLGSIRSAGASICELALATFDRA